MNVDIVNGSFSMVYWKVERKKSIMRNRIRKKRLGLLRICLKYAY